MADKIPITIVGGGAVGCAIAYELSKDGREVVLFDRNPKIPGENQSSRNSGVIHAGIYYRKDAEPLKARLCVEGNKRMYDFCKEFNVSHSQTGKLVVASSKLEEEYLDGALRIAGENGIPGVRKVYSGAEIKAMEPNVNADSALLVPTSGIVDPTALVRKLKGLAEARGAYLMPGHRVTYIKPERRGFSVTVESRGGRETYETDMLINSAGLYSDEIARMVNPENNYEIIPIRLEAVKFSRDRREELKMKGMNVYPAPRGFDPRERKVLDIPYMEFEKLRREGRAGTYPGVHLTPSFDLVNGEWVVGDTVTIGPAFTQGKGKEDLGENSMGSEIYVKAIKSYFPGIRAEDISPHQVGIMAKLKGGNDFVIKRDNKFPDCINLVGIDSPGLTSSLAIANYVGEMVKESRGINGRITCEDLE